jgi:hypothetical protein
MVLGAVLIVAVLGFGQHAIPLKHAHISVLRDDTPVCRTANAVCDPLPPQRVAAGTGHLRVNLPPGAYQVKALIGSAEVCTSKGVTLRSGQRQHVTLRCSTG